MAWKRLLLAAMFLLPITYLGQIFSTAVHEIVGHGLVAVLVGGRFDGFHLEWDGMGWAYAYMLPGASLSQHVAMLAGGVLATTVVGAVLLAVARVRRLPIPMQLICVVLGLCCLLEGPPYILWNAYHPAPPGDIARILLLLSHGGSTDVTALRWAMVGLGGIIVLLGTVLGFAMLMCRLAGLLRPDGLLKPAQQIILLLLVVLPASGAWLLFDWNQIAPGIGVLPQVVGIATFWLAAILLYARPAEPLLAETRFATLVSYTLGSWLAFGLILLMTVSVFSNGVIWHHAPISAR